jgi:hypothetical protein
MAKLLALLLCERATFNRNEKVTLHGLFDGLRIPRAGRVPGGNPNSQLFFVFYKILTEAPCTIGLKIISPSGEPIDGNWTDSVTVSSASPLTWQSIWALTTDLFQASGSYRLELLRSNGDSPVPIGQTELFVEHI